MQYLVGKLLKTALKFIEYTTERAYSKYTMSYKKPSFNTPPRGHQVQVLERRELDALDVHIADLARQQRRAAAAPDAAQVPDLRTAHAVSQSATQSSSPTP